MSDIFSSAPLARGERYGFNDIATTIAVSIIAILINVPFVTAILTSFKTTAAISDPLSLPIGGNATLGHYENAIYAAGYDFAGYFRNSVIISGSVVLAVLVLGIPAAYAIVRLNLGGRWLLSAVAGLRLLPAIFFVLPLFLMFSQFRLIDTLWAMIIVDTFLNIPIVIVLLTRAISELPIEIEEAAQVDGASTFRTLLTIVTPLLAPTLVAAATISFLFSWNDYLFAVVMTTTQARTIVAGATNFITSFGVLWGDISAVTVLSVALPVTLSIFAQRYLVQGLAAGAVK
jgi:multiple sugar transport system permease protein